MNLPRRGKTLLAVILAAAALAGGCVSNIDPNVPEPIRTFFEPAQGSKYLLYRPSSYDRKYAWPLVIVCHSGFPDSPQREIRDWTQLAERQGFLVAAPELTSPRLLNPKTDKAIELEREDDERILSVIRHVRAGHSISDDRIFIYGWEKGAHAALYSGLRHPTLFRAIALMSPAFNENLLPEPDIGVSPDQFVYVNYDVADSILQRRGVHCARWLRAHGARVDEDRSGNASRKQAERAVLFFEHVIRDTTWMHIEVRPSPNEDSLERLFRVQSVRKPTKLRWTFGDGDESRVGEPLHRYAAAGTYRVEVTASFSGQPDATRAITLTLPQGLAVPAPANKP